MNSRINSLTRSILVISYFLTLASSLVLASPKGKHVTINVTSSSGGMIQAVSSPRPSEMLEPPRDEWLREGTVIDTLEEGSNRFYAVVPCDDYQIDSLIVDDTLTDFPRQNPMLKISQYRWPIWSFRELSKNHSIRVKFRPVEDITISASATEGGKIIPSGGIILARHSQQNFTSKAATGYRLVHVIVDGQTFDPTESYTFSNVTTSHTIQAVFEKSEN